MLRDHVSHEWEVGKYAYKLSLSSIPLGSRILLTSHWLLPETCQSLKESNIFWEGSFRCSNCDIFTLVRALLAPFQWLPLVEIISGIQIDPAF